MTTSQQAIGWLIALGAMTKSAQFPFHTWLPNTMETPTPVSALMHAGIVNAGGYLIIRMSAFFALSPDALVMVAAVGAATASFGGVVMMTQSNVKQALAYSTIAQMGFMMLQCGLGAYSAAMLHILAHSFYKAYAFLTSGSVIAQKRALRTSNLHAGLNGKPRLKLAAVVASVALSVLALMASCTLFGFTPVQEPGGVLLMFILCLALATWSYRLLIRPEWQTKSLAVASTFALSVAYVGSYSAIHFIVAPSLSEGASSEWMQIVLLDAFLGFCLLLSLHVAIIRRTAPRWLETFRIHASNGFYIDTLYQRVSANLARS